MKTLVQRVSRAEVRVDGRPIGRIGVGLLVFVGVERGDAVADAEYFAEKTAELRVFADEQGRMNRSLTDVGGAALVVSQFTLAADTRRGRRPSWGRAASPDEAVPLYEHFIDCLRRRSIDVERGRFQAMMEVELVNDGPVTLVLER